MRGRARSRGPGDTADEHEGARAARARGRLTHSGRGRGARPCQASRTLPTRFISGPCRARESGVRSTAPQPSWVERTEGAGRPTCGGGGVPSTSCVERTRGGMPRPDVRRARRPVPGARAGGPLLPAVNAREPPGWAALVEDIGGDLLSQALASQVPSALRGLTALFGMGRGVSPSL